MLFGHLFLYQEDFMEAALLISAIILLGLGLLGTFLPVLPGPPLAWAVLLCESFIPESTMSITILVITFITAVIITVLDFAFPAIQTKKSGGTKYGTRGSTVGLIVGLFTGPWGPNFHLQRTRFFVMMSHINAGQGKPDYFLAPHYPLNQRIFRFGVSWNFYN